MRDPGLDKAIEAAGGVRALARALGVSQPAVSAWKKVPPERVAAVEAATGVLRAELRPDLFGEAAAVDIAPEDAARAEEYALLGALIWRAPTADLLTRLASLRGDASELGAAHHMLADAARNADAEKVGREFFDLFIGVGRSEIMPYGSYYRTGFLNERPLAEVRADMEKLGLAREDRVGEPEDHIAILFDVMRGLIAGDFAAAGVDEQAFFARHIKPWAVRMFADLETSETSAFYRAVGAAGRIFMDIEAGAMALAA
jgi:TorA maturation chaperone TorD